MEEGRPSQTAMLVAMLRAYHHEFTAEPRIVDDPLAMPLTGLTSTAQLKSYYAGIVNMLAALSDQTVAEAMQHNLTMGVCARSRFAEQQLEQSRARGMQQLIILGAGLDSTAYRCAELTTGMQIFEVDYPATQVWKREQLAKSNIAIPDNLKFVSFDFEHQTLAKALAAGGIRRDAMSFFSWLGVQPYLTDQAVMTTLDVIATFAPGSELVLDIMTPNEPFQSEAMAQGLRKVREALARNGEPFKSMYEPDAFHARLQQRGFNHIKMLSVQEWFDQHSERYQGRFTATSGQRLVSAQI